jgi:hypothetical protein
MQEEPQTKCENFRCWFHTNGLCWKIPVECEVRILNNNLIKFDRPVGSGETR